MPIDQSMTSISRLFDNIEKKLDLNLWIAPRYGLITTKDGQKFFNQAGKEIGRLRKDKENIEIDFDTKIESRFLKPQVFIWNALFGYVQAGKPSSFDPEPELHYLVNKPKETSHSSFVVKPSKFYGKEGLKPLMQFEYIAISELKIKL